MFSWNLVEHFNFTASIWWGKAAASVEDCYGGLLSQGAERAVADLLLERVSHWSYISAKASTNIYTVSPQVDSPSVPESKTLDVWNWHVYTTTLDWFSLFILFLSEAFRDSMPNEHSLPHLNQGDCCVNGNVLAWPWATWLTGFA